MKQPLFLLLTMLTTLTTSAQQPAKDSSAPHPGHYSSDSFHLRVPGRRISFYSFCTPYSEGRAVYFRKDQDEAIHRVNFHNLSVALADNPASMHQLRIARTNAYLTIGLFAGGAALTAVGFIITDNHYHTLTNTYNQASAKWFAAAQTNPGTPMPALPHYTGPGALFYLGTAMTLSCMIPLFNVANHSRKAVDIYNGID